MPLFTEVRGRVILRSSHIPDPMQIIGASCIMSPYWGSPPDRGSTRLRPSEQEEEYLDATTDRAEAALSSGAAGSYAEGGGTACRGIGVDRVPSGERQTNSLHAERDEDRQGIRCAPRGVVGGGVASRRLATASLRFIASPARPSARTSAKRRSRKYA